MGKEGAHTHNLDTLPPLDARLYNPSTQGRIPTPLDDLHLVDIPQLITDVKATVDPAYEWPQQISTHHFYWPVTWYSSDGIASRCNPSTFRNLPIHKGLVPRVFENWLHAVTLPPPLPDPEIMDYRVEAWTVARDLFKLARKTVHWERLARRRRELIAKNPHIVPEGFDGVDIIGEEVMHEVLERHFRGFERQRKRQDQIPQALRIVDLEGTPAVIARNLGKIVARPSLHLTRTIAA